MMRRCRTVVAMVYVGTWNKRTRKTVPISRLERVIQAWCDKVGACVTVTPTRFVYTNGSERGIAVGFINYPRFPKTARTIQQQAIELSRLLKSTATQWGVSVVGPTTTMLISDAEDKP